VRETYFSMPWASLGQAEVNSAALRPNYPEIVANSAPAIGRPTYLISRRPTLWGVDRFTLAGQAFPMPCGYSIDGNQISAQQEQIS
jgi:hypothetical protein